MSSSIVETIRRIGGRLTSQEATRGWWRSSEGRRASRSPEPADQRRRADAAAVDLPADESAASALLADLAADPADLVEVAALLSHDAQAEALP